MSKSELHDWECAIEKLCGDNADKMLDIAQDIYNTAFVRGKNHMTWEQEHCEDLVSRQAVFDMATTIQTDDYSGNETMEVVDVDDIKALPSVTPTTKWIPVSERLPEENKDVLIDIKEGEEHTFFVTRLVDVTYWIHLGRDVNVVAWMPLPEPYKVEMEEKE